MEWEEFVGAAVLVAGLDKSDPALLRMFRRDLSLQPPRTLDELDADRAYNNIPPPDAGFKVGNHRGFLTREAKTKYHNGLAVSAFKMALCARSDPVFAEDFVIHARIHAVNACAADPNEFHGRLLARLKEISNPVPPKSIDF